MNGLSIVTNSTLATDYLAAKYKEVVKSKPPSQISAGRPPSPNTVLQPPNTVSRDLQETQIAAIKAAEILDDAAKGALNMTEKKVEELKEKLTKANKSLNQKNRDTIKKNNTKKNQKAKEKRDLEKKVKKLTNKLRKAEEKLKEARFVTEVSGELGSRARCKPQTAADDLLIDKTVENTLDINTLDKLLKQGADINGACGDGYTLLHWAVIRNNNEMVTALIERKAELNSKSNFFEHTPLCCAIMNKDKGIILQLINAGADINNKRSLAEAFALEDKTIYTLLIEHGADINGTLS